MSGSSGVGPIDPHDQKMYEQEYQRGADLFQKALDQYGKSDNPYQKAEFKDVMDKAMQVLNESAKELMNQELLKQNEAIATDYTTFQKHPSDRITQEKLSKDLGKAKNSIG